MCFDQVFPFKIKFAAGPTGYNTILDLQMPLPSIRTLQRRMQRIKFQAFRGGLFFFKLKAEAMCEKEKECVFSLNSGWDGHYISVYG